MTTNRELGNRGSEGIVLGNLAVVELLRTGDIARAGGLAAQGETVLSAVGDRSELAQLLCTRGHIALAGGKPAPMLDRVRALAE